MVRPPVSSRSSPSSSSFASLRTAYTKCGARYRLDPWRGQDDLLGDRLVVLLLRDELGLEHLGEHEVAHDDGLRRRRDHVDGLAVTLLLDGLGGGVEPRWRPHQTGEHRGLADRQLVLGRVGGDVLAEVGVGGGPDPVRVVPVVGLVHVHLEDLLLALGAGVAPVETQGQDRLLDLALDLAVGIGHEVSAEEAHAHELLADRRCAGHRLAGLEVLEEGADDAAEVDTRVVPEALVLGRHLGVDHDLRDLLERDLASILDGERGELGAVGRDDGRPLGQVDVLDVLDGRKVARVRRVDAQDAAEERQRGEAEGDEDDAGRRGRPGSASRVVSPCPPARCGSPARRRWSSGHSRGRVARKPGWLRWAARLVGTES